MALRVLLADESSTIKKVFQLALQDFAVEVRPVNVGIDVVAVAQSFKPDIVFADVMLQKRSGYEVAAELKQNPLLKGIPVVLMWSGFISLDEDKFQASHANAQLEKPFDVSALRKLVTDLVPRTQSQRLSQFLTFPKMPDMEEPPPQKPSVSPPELPAVPDEEFQQMPIPKMKSTQSEKYRLNFKPEELEPEHVPVDYQEPDSDQVDIGTDEEEPFTMRSAAPPPTAPKIPAPKAPSSAPDMNVETRIDIDMAALESDELGAIERVDLAAASTPPRPAAGLPLMPASAPDLASLKVPSLTVAQLEKIIREQSAEVIESIVWKVVPDLAAQMIERELNRLLKERDSQY